MLSTTLEKTIDVLRSMLLIMGYQSSSRHSLPYIIQIPRILKANGINITILSTLHHTASNGQVEDFAQTLKSSLKASDSDNNGKTLGHRLAEFLFEYRATPCIAEDRSNAND